MKFTRLEVPRCAVGEGPVWDVTEQAFYWIDIVGKAVFRLTHLDGDVRKWDLPNNVGSMALRKDGGAIVALWDGVYTLDFQTGECLLLATHPDFDGQVLADGKVDRRGRFIVGSSHRDMKEAVGKLYALDPGATELRPIDDDIILANGPCWSRDDKTFYHADSVRKLIYAYDYDIEAGTVSGRRAFASTEALGGIPDGATVDAEDHVWSAICEGKKLVRFRPDGSIERVVDFPVKLPGSVMFGGPKLDQLFVPSLDPAFFGREGDPLDGSTYMVEDLGVSGIPEPRFGG